LQLGRSPLAVAARDTPGVIRTPNRGLESARLPIGNRGAWCAGPCRRMSRTSTLPFLRRLPLPLGLRARGGLGRIRTDTGHGLSILARQSLGRRSRTSDFAIYVTHSAPGLPPTRRLLARRRTKRDRPVARDRQGCDNRHRGRRAKTCAAKGGKSRQCQAGDARNRQKIGKSENGREVGKR
jgi:hypothetical protein